MRKILLKLLTITVLMLMIQMIQAQTGIKGVVKDSESGETLIGATVVLEGTTAGTATDTDGKFILATKTGSIKVNFTYVGYVPLQIETTVQSGEYTNLGTVKMKANAISLGGVSILADRAKERETPVAFSNVQKKQIEEQLGSRDIPLAMDVTPNVYSTMQGGGAGDARMSVRGFNQRNVAVMINGVPINDMENGWVYWSNWDGVGDATSSIQMQRGLSAVNLATPSIGGTMNVITNPADQKPGITYKQEFGTGAFMKSTLMAHSGLINNKFAVSAGGVRKTGDGVIDKTWTDAWAYYFGASWNINSKNRLELYALGAPQRHGQNAYKQNIAAYSHAYATSEFDYPQAALDKFPESQSGRKYNETWGPVSYKYTAKEYWNGKEHDRYSPDYINQVENYFHKPLVNLNWFTQWSEKVTQYTVAYYSGGTGGGTGTLGSMKYDRTGPSQVVDYNATMANNMLTDTARGIMRNSVNNQWSLGLISKVKWVINDKFTTSYGIDGRTAEIDHFREVRDLIGGKFFIDTKDQFAMDDRKFLGDKVDYHNINTVNWLGGFAQGEYNYDNITAYAMAGYSVIKYGFNDYFHMAPGTTDRLTTKSDWIAGYQVKGGMNYRFTETINGFINLGYVAKVPIFDNVIDDTDGSLAKNPKTENFTSYEGGVQYKSLNNKFSITGNLYYTLWTNRALTKLVQNPDGSDDLVFITGMDQRHYGLEIEGQYRPVDAIGFMLAGSVNNWVYLNNVSGSYKNYSTQDSLVHSVDYNFYVKDLRVGDAPQTQAVLGVTLYPVKGLQVQLLGKYYANYYADWDPFSRTVEGDNAQVWKVPDYTVFDLHASYDLPIKGSTGVQVFVHVFNLFDDIFVQDAVDNSQYNGYYGDNNEFSHTASSAEVYLGLPRTVNFGMILTIR